MFEIILRLIIFLFVTVYILGCICYVPFAFLLMKLHEQSHINIAHKLFCGFLSLLNLFTDRFLELEGQNLIKKDENYLIISNHVNEYDFFVFSSLFKNSESLGALKFVMKSEMRNYFGIYQCLNLLNFLTIERNYNKDEKLLKEYCKRVRDLKIPLNMIIFPEGTIITENTLIKSDEYRKSKNLPLLRFVLSPKYKGFNLLKENLTGSQIKNVLDVTFIYPNKSKPRLLEMLFSNKKYKVAYKMNTYPIYSIVNSEKFINERWYEKERWLATKTKKALCNAKEEKV